MIILEQILLDLYISNYGYEHVLKYYQYFNKQIKKEINDFLRSEFRDYRKNLSTKKNSIFKILFFIKL